MPTYGTLRWVSLYHIDLTLIPESKFPAKAGEAVFGNSHSILMLLSATYTGHKDVSHVTL